MIMQAVIGLLFVVGLCSGASIPNYINICKRTDPKVNECIVNAVETLKPRFKDGIPELHVPPMEPLKLEPIIIDRGSGNSVFKLKLVDMDLYGTSNFRINNLKLDVSNHIYKIDLTFPRLRMTGVCDVDTKLLSLPINGNGKFDANATNCQATGILKAQIYEKDGQKYMRFTDLTLNLNIDDYSILLSELFEDDALTETINELLNQNKENFIDIAIPFIQNKASQIILELANHIVDQFPYEDLFPQN